MRVRVRVRVGVRVRARVRVGVDPEPSPNPRRSEALAKHDSSFAPLAKALSDNAAQIEKELIDCQVNR